MQSSETGDSLLSAQEAKVDFRSGYLKEVGKAIMEETDRRVFDKIMSEIVENDRKAWAGVDINEFLAEQRGDYK